MPLDPVAPHIAVPQVGLPGAGLRFRIASIVLTSALLAACASTPPRDGRVEILSTAGSQALDGANCVVETGAGIWNVTTPGFVQVGPPQGDLRVVCNKEGYRTSEVLFRGGTAGAGGSRLPSVGIGVGGGFGGYSSVGVSLGLGFPLSGPGTDYPARVVVEMAPL